jgi:hypothetical protein
MAILEESRPTKRVGVVRMSANFRLLCILCTIWSALLLGGCGYKIVKVTDEPSGTPTPLPAEAALPEIVDQWYAARNSLDHPTLYMLADPDGDRQEALESALNSIVNLAKENAHAKYFNLHCLVTGPTDGNPGVAFVKVSGDWEANLVGKDSFEAIIEFHLQGNTWYVWSATDLF